ncbi:MAG: hypothetical protein ABW321_34840 [Polyangiales bacterium]
MDTTSSTEPLVQTAHALETQAALRAWPGLRAVWVRGDDRVSWLNGQLTNDVRQIAPGGSVHALAVNVRGKILAELWVADLGEALLLLLPESVESSLLENLERYIIMEDVTLERAPELRVVSIEGPLAQERSANVSAEGVTAIAWSPLGLGGRAFIGSAEALAPISTTLAQHSPSVSPEAYDLVRLRRGVPRFGIDFDEHNYPQEAGLKALVSFKKGCYLGQEVVCTLENRGRLSRQLWKLRGSDINTLALAAGTALHASEAATDAVGAITSSVWDPTQREHRLLGYVRRNHATAGAVVQAGAQSLTLIAPVGEDEVATTAPAR